MSKPQVKIKPVKRTPPKPPLPPPTTNQKKGVKKGGKS
jgi:hypothetical protein